MFPPDDPAYEWLADGKCQKILDQVTAWQENGVPELDLLLYRGAASACLGNWKVAIEDLTAVRDSDQHRQDLDESTEPVECNDSCPRCRQIVFQWLSDLVDAHQRDPEATLVFTRSSEPSLCPDPETTTSTTEEQPD